MRPPVIAGLISLILGIGVLVFLMNQKRDVKVFVPPKANDLPTYGVAPDFMLTDTENASFDSKQLQGKVWVADFFFSSCGGPCPLMAGNMQTLQAQFGNRDDVRLVNISVDPETDTPEELKNYAKRLKANTDFWHFLGGPEEEIKRISVDGFKIGNADNIMNHSPKFVLVDRQGMIRGYYTGTEPTETQKLIQDLEMLL